MYLNKEDMGNKTMEESNGDNLRQERATATQGPRLLKDRGTSLVLRRENVEYKQSAGTVGSNENG